MTVLRARRQQAVTQHLFHEWPSPEGDQWALFYRCSNDYLVRFIDFADFTISSDAQNILVYPVPGVPQDMIDHLYLNLILPLALSHQNKLVLHASAIEIDDCSVVFAGSSGCGKSTLAASFSTNGYRFLTDDGVQLENEGMGYVVRPSHASIRLWGDSRDELITAETNLMSLKSSSSKFRFMANDPSVFCDQSRALRHVYFLGEGDTTEVSIEAVSGTEAMVGLVSHSFLLDISKKQLLEKNFKQISQLAQEPIFYRLDYPRRYEVLPEVRETVLSHCRLKKEAAARYP